MSAFRRAQLALSGAAELPYGDISSIGIGCRRRPPGGSQRTSICEGGAAEKYSSRIVCVPTVRKAFPAASATFDARNFPSIQRSTSPAPPTSKP